MTCVKPQQDPPGNVCSLSVCLPNFFSGPEVPRGQGLCLTQPTSLTGDGE